MKMICKSLFIILYLSGSMFSQYSNSGNNFNYGNSVSYLGWQGYDNGVISCLVVNKSGTILASGGYDGVIKLWNLQNYELIRTIPAHNSDITSMDFSPDGNKIASAGRLDRNSKIWEVVSGKLLYSFGNESVNLCIKYSPDGTKIAKCGDTNSVCLYNAENGRFINGFNIPGYQIQVRSFIFSPDGKKIYSCDGGKNIYVENCETGSLIKCYKAEFNSNYLIISPDGSKIAYGNKFYLNIIKTEDGSLVNRFDSYPYNSNILTACFSPDGKYIAFGCGDNTNKIAYINTGELQKVFYEHKYNIESICYTPDGKQIISGSIDGTIKIWDTETGKEIKSLSGHNLLVQMAFSPDGNRLVSGGYLISQGGKVEMKLWNAQTGNLIKKIDKLAGGFIVAPDGKKFASFGSYDDSNVYIWDINTGNLLKTIDENTLNNQNIIFSIDSKKIIAGAYNSDGRIRIWDVETGELSLSWKGIGVFDKIILSPDGRMTASSSRVASNATIYIRNSETGDIIRIFEGHRSGIESLSFSPDGKKIASSGCDNLIKVWDIEKGDLLYCSETYNGHLYCVVFSPDGKYLTSCCSDGTIEFRDASTCNIKNKIYFDQGYPAYLSYSADGKKLATGGLGYINIRIYDMETLTAKPPKKISAGYNLYQNYPNPFNPTTVLSFSVETHGRASVQMKIYDVLGREIKTIIDKSLSAGNYSYEFNGSGLPSGVYYYTLKTNGSSETKKMILAK